MAFRATSYQQTLEEGGVSPEAARAHTRAMEEFVVSEVVTREYLDARLDQLRSEFKMDITELRGEISDLRSEVKTDIAELRNEVKADITGLRSEVNTKIAELETRLVRWMVGSMAATITILFTLLRLTGGS